MTTKKKLKKKIRKQKTAHLLEMSDLHIQLDKLKYAITFAEARASQLAFQNKKLVAQLNEINNNSTNLKDEQNNSSQEQSTI